MVTSSFQAERRVLEDILAKSILIVSWLYTSVKLFTHSISESIELGLSLEIMIFFSVTFIDGMITIFHAFLDENGHLTSMNGARYLGLLQNTV